MPRPTTADLAEGYADLCQMEPDAQRVILTLIRRATIARQKYGDLCLSTDPRDMRAEAGEELVDACFYLAAQVMR